MGAIYEDVHQGRPPRDEHLDELWREACGRSHQMDNRQIKKLFLDYLEVAEGIAPASKKNASFVLGGEFSARFWELVEGRETFSAKNIRKMLRVARANIDHFVQVFIRSLDDDLSGEVDQFEFKEKIARLLFGAGAPLGQKLQYQGVAAFMKEYRLNSLQLEMMQYTNVMEQVMIRLKDIAAPQLERPFLIVKCTVRNPTSRVWEDIQRMIEDLIGSIHLESTTSLDEIGPSIFMGSLETARELSDLNVNGITHILAVGNRVKSYFPDKFKYLILDGIKEDPYQQITDRYDEAWHFLRDCVRDSGRAFIHSHSGFSRSSAFVIMYLMKSQDMTYESALGRVRKRVKCLPNIGFEIQLREYQRTGFSTDPAAYSHLNLEEMIPRYVVHLSNRVPLFHKLLQQRAKVGNELLYITQHLYSVQDFDFDPDVQRIMAIAVERLRNIQTSLVKSHASVRAFHRKFPKEKYAWVNKLDGSAPSTPRRSMGQDGLWSAKTSKATSSSSNRSSASKRRTKKGQGTGLPSASRAHPSSKPSEPYKTGLGTNRQPSQDAKEQVAAGAGHLRYAWPRHMGGLTAELEASDQFQEDTPIKRLDTMNSVATDVTTTTDRDTQRSTTIPTEFVGGDSKGFWEVHPSVPTWSNAPL